uniref:Cytochrome c oxidase subunit 3 n=1 Tax=Eurytrema pancreaticum TaxID=374591 RepID=A0A0E3U338_EUTPN|nr:cytochrome c oxidase subunit 3 [Eurytrema pancreaticum]
MSSNNSNNSWLPFLTSWYVLWYLLSSFLWHPFSLFVCAWINLYLLTSYLIELSRCGFRSRLAFCLFVGTEFIVFFTLLVTVAWYNTPEVTKLSHYGGFPAINTVVLLSSSITASAFHHSFGTARGFFWLKITLMLGFVFIVLQYFEWRQCCLNLVDSNYASAALCLIGMHFIHVLAGFTALTYIYLWYDRFDSFHYPELVVWYWHFVDYVWLLVYLFVYVM